MRKVYLFFLALILAAATATTGYAQGNAQLTGTVLDPTGAVVPDVAVTATNQATNVTYATQTTGAGLYRFPALPVGTYALEVRAPGFRVVRVENIVLTVGQVVTEDVALEVGAVTETVTVEGEGIQLVKTASSEVSGLVDRNTLAALPLEVRDPIAFVNLLPGAVPSALGNFEFNGSTRGSAVNGARGGTGNFLLDGFDNNDQGQGGRSHNTVGSIPGAITGVSPDAIQEFRVVTSNFSAQYGRQGGFVADAVLKSGSNQIHGSAFEYNRNQSITAQDFFSNKFGAEDSLVRNQFGGSLGGPIRKDKTFVFGTVEIQRLRQGVPNIVTSITPEFIDFVRSGQFAAFHESDPGGFCLQFFGVACPGDFANSATLGPIADGLLQRFPMPVPVSDFTPDSGNLFTLFGVPTTYPVNIFGSADVRNNSVFNQNRFSVKLDHNFNETNRLSGFMAFDDFDSVDSSLGTDTTGSPHFPITAASRSQNWGLTYTHIFSPSLVSEFKGGYLRHNAGFPRDIAPEVPSIVTALDALTVGFGMTSSLPQDFTENQFQVANNTAYTYGRHSLKMGAEYRRTRNGSTAGFIADGLFLPYDIENLLTDGWFGSDADQLLFGGDAFGSFFFAQAAINPLTGDSPEFYRGYRANEFGSYIQDDWKIHPRLTLNIGLRWDYFGVPHNFRPGLDSNFFFGSGITPLAAPFTPGVTAPNPFFPVNSPEYARVASGRFVQKDRDIWSKDTNNFAPRFGLAWDVRGNQKTVIRLGGGVFYDRFWNNLFENIRLNPPFFSFNTIGTFINDFPVSPTATPGLYSIPISTQLFNDPAFAPTPSPRHMDENTLASYIEQAFFGIQHQFTSDMLVEFNYIGTFGHKLTGIVDINTFSGRTIDAIDPVTGFPFNNSRPNPNIGGDNARGNYYNSNYHALQVGLTKRYSHGLQFQSNYTWSKALDYVSDAFQSRQGTQDNIYPRDPLNRALEYGRADFDLRHRFVTSVLYDLPLWRQNRWAGGWTVGSIITLQTGLPIQIFDSGLDSNADGRIDDRPDFVGSGDINDIVLDSSPADGYFDTSVFAAPQMDPNVNNGLWRLGTLGRNVLSAPGLAIVDFSLQKKFRITERVSFRVDANFFNVFNRTNFGFPDGNLSSATFGQSINSFGPRIGQFAARFDF